MEILEMGEEELLALSLDTRIGRLMSADEILHIFKILGGFWSYDEEAAKAGRPGYHAQLKSGRHSDGFLYSKAALRHDNICWLMAEQLVLKWEAMGIPKPLLVAGIPDGATQLGEFVADLMGADVNSIKMVKEDGKIQLVSNIAPDCTLLLIEDFCTKGTGFKEAVLDIISKQPGANILPYELVIIKRGGLESIEVEGVGSFKVNAIANHRISDWALQECPLCKEFGSEAIKPKATEEDWERLMNSQLA